jgi:hypothetical protein
MARASAPLKSIPGPNSCTTPTLLAGGHHGVAGSDHIGQVFTATPGQDETAPTQCIGRAAEAQADRITSGRFLPQPGARRDRPDTMHRSCCGSSGGSDHIGQVFTATRGKTRPPRHNASVVLRKLRVWRTGVGSFCQRNRRGTHPASGTPRHARWRCAIATRSRDIRVP